MRILDETVENYIKSNCQFFDGVLGEIQRESIDKGIPIIPCEIARFMTTLLCVNRPKKVLEIGCAVGFSTGLIANYLQCDGTITTIEKDNKMAEIAKENFSRLSIQNKVTLLQGDAVDIVPTLDETFDLIFLDAAKGQYLQLLPYCIEKLNLNGLLIADDILQKGRTVMKREDVIRRQRTIHKRMNTFIYALTHTEGLESSIVPLEDGVLIATKTEEFKEINYGI